MERYEPDADRDRRRPCGRLRRFGSARRIRRIPAPRLAGGGLVDLSRRRVRTRRPNRGNDRLRTDAAMDASPPPRGPGDAHRPGVLDRLRQARRTGAEGDGRSCSGGRHHARSDRRLPDRDGSGLTRSDLRFRPARWHRGRADHPGTRAAGRLPSPRSRIDRDGSDARAMDTGSRRVAERPARCGGRFPTVEPGPRAPAVPGSVQWPLWEKCIQSFSELHRPPHPHPIASKALVTASPSKIMPGRRHDLFV